MEENVPMKGRGLLIALGILGLVAAVVLLGSYIVAGIYNTLVAKQQAVKGQWAQVETVLQRRYDLIPNLVSTVKGYAKHEAGVLEEVTRLRSQWGEAKAPAEKIKASNELEGALGRLMVVMENYPDLKANVNFLKLQDKLTGTENGIASERMTYNETVRTYNLALQQFPSNVFAAAFGFRSDDNYFKSKEEAKEPPKVEF